MLREGIASVVRREPDMELVGEAENGARGVEVFRQLKPDVTLMDIQMPLLNGVDAITAIRAEFPTARIIALTTYKGDVQAQRALKAGAAGYLLKSTLGPSLIDTIRLVHAGRRHIPAEVAQEIAIHAMDATLSSRELGVLALVAQGRSNKEIANLLDISEDTVKAHMKSLFVKLNVNDRTEAVTLAHKRGMIEI
jgi:DNA-binding NarL/FixJ family response regulator